MGLPQLDAEDALLSFWRTRYVKEQKPDEKHTYKLETRQNFSGRMFLSNSCKDEDERKTVFSFVCFFLR